MQFHPKNRLCYLTVHLGFTWQNTALVEAVFFWYDMRLNGRIMRRNGNLETLKTPNMRISMNFNMEFVEVETTNIWLNYHISLTWMKAMSGDDFPKTNHDSSYNLPRNMGISGHQIIWCPENPGNAEATTPRLRKKTLVLVQIPTDTPNKCTSTLAEIRLENSRHALYGNQMYYPRMGFISYCDFPINNIEFLPCHSWLPKGCCFVLFLGVVPTKYKLNPEFLLLRSSWLFIWTPRTLIIPNLYFPFAESAFCWWKIHFSRGWHPPAPPSTPRDAEAVPNCDCQSKSSMSWKLLPGCCWIFTVAWGSVFCI